MIFDPNALVLQRDTGPEVPEDILKDATALSKSPCTPDEALAGLKRFLPVLQTARLDTNFVLACATLVEKQRFKDGMLDFWSGMQVLLHDHDMPLRMLMRWYLREKQAEEGMIRLRHLLPNSDTDICEGQRMVMAMHELQLFHDLDAWIRPMLSRLPDAAPLRLSYIRSLYDQGRFYEAFEQVNALPEDLKLSASQQKMIDAIEQKSQVMSGSELVDRDDIIARLAVLAQSYPVRPRSPEGRLGNVVFFTGQLGAGGAERQLTRIATAMHTARRESGHINGTKLAGDIRVCVRHVNAATSSDFFLPVLQEAEVDVTTLVDTPMVGVEDLPAYIDQEFRDLLELMPRDLMENTCKLIQYFRENETEVAYLWQDGGVMASALAALAAGVPCIIASFRGKPPNMRPELMRQHMPVLFKTLATQTRVRFSANNNSSARSYEEWLGMENGAIQVIYNATPPILPDGTPQDEEWWEDVCARSPQCTQTVLGVFRYDHNKRPKFWIETAMELARQNSHIRFVIVGAGVELAQCRVMVEAAGMQDRIFLAGARSHVGYFMHNADLLMHLARMEGLPNVIIEAQLSGLPVLATPAGGTEEIVQDGITGLILSDNIDPPGNEVLDKLNSLLLNPDKLHAMGQAGKARSETLFLPGNILERTISLFKDTI
ncbi:MAG: hypothetical protein CSA68_11340 [Rhodobacterales bacterium]|nr:MAG: hypothetical protein CSA68_11340 [Rhodobacterales bacterium]